MSWRVSFTGEVKEARARISEQFANSGACVEPEESIRQAAAKIIDSALEAQGLYPNVGVSAYGSMSKDSSTGAIAN